MTVAKNFRVGHTVAEGPPYREDAFTAPNDRCPHPEWWTCDDDESAELEVTVLVAALVVALQPEFVVEAGTAFGQTAEKIGRALADNGHGTLASLDIDESRIAVARERCAGLPVTFACVDVAEFIPDRPIDFAWIDSGMNRAAELSHLSEWFRSGGMAGVHDTGPQHAVRDALETVSGFRAVYLPTPRGVALLEKL